MHDGVVRAVAHARATGNARNHSRHLREKRKPWGEVIHEDWEKSRREKQRKKRTRAFLTKRFPGM